MEIWQLATCGHGLQHSSNREIHGRMNPADIGVRGGAEAVFARKNQCP